MWDTWLYKRGNQFILNYLVKHHSGRWNAVSTATSSDGAHWTDLGVAIRKDCASPNDCAVWLGSGSVWKLVKQSKNEDTDEDEFVMNFSEDYDCGSAKCQSIFFATSKDLITWTPVAPDAEKKGGLVFKYNTSFYKDGGRWDCIAVLPRPGGGYYGYWTATPLPHGNGAGFGESADGLHWTALKSPGPNVPGGQGLHSGQLPGL
jgi:hypothetical protein